MILYYKKNNIYVIYSLLRRLSYFDMKEWKISEFFSWIWEKNNKSKTFTFFSLQKVGETNLLHVVGFFFFVFALTTQLQIRYITPQLSNENDSSYMIVLIVKLKKIYIDKIHFRNRSNS